MRGDINNNNARKKKKQLICIGSNIKEQRIFQYTLRKAVEKPAWMKGKRIYCPDCGIKVGSSDNFCRKCGQRIKERIPLIKVNFNYNARKKPSKLPGIKNCNNCGRNRTCKYQPEPGRLAKDDCQMWKKGEKK